MIQILERTNTTTVAGLKNLAFLRNLDDWRQTLEYGERAVASRLVPFTTANGSTVYRRANAQTTTQAQPKQTITKPADLSTANANSQKNVYVDFGNGVSMLNGSVLKNGKIFTVKYSSQETTKMYEMAKKMARQDLPDASKGEILQHADDLYASFLLTDKILRAKGQTPLVTLSNFEETLYGVRNRVVYGERNADNTTSAKVLNTTFDAAYVADMIIGGVYLVKGIKNIPKMAKVVKLKMQRGEWNYGSFKPQAKWASQFLKRGWTDKEVTEAIVRGKRIKAVNLVNPFNSATRYMHPRTGKSVVIDDVTKELLHIGGEGFKY